MRGWLLLLLLLSVPLCSTFVCYTCDGDDCFTPERWLAMTCPGGTSRCYMLRSTSDKVFRRGCAPFDCNEMSIPRGARCDPCYSEKCNGNAKVDLSGGGGVWGPRTSPASALLLIPTGLLVLFLSFC